MGERGWLLRDAIRRILSHAPPPPATWPAVLRRSLVIVALFCVGLALGEMPFAVLACFGALQVALVEVVLPLHRLVRLLIPLVFACAAATAVAMALGGTWLAVVAITGLAYVFGCTGTNSARAMTIGVSALALAVIFGADARPLDQVPLDVGYVVFGMVVQTVICLLMWSPERRWFIRRAIANKLRADVDMISSPTISPEDLVRTHAQGDLVRSALSSAQLSPDHDLRMRGAASASIIVTRALIAWMTLDRPGDKERVDVGLAVKTQARRLDGLFRVRRGAARAVDVPEGADARDGSGARGQVEESLTVLDRAVSAAVNPALPADTLLVGFTKDRLSAPEPPLPFWPSLLPSSPTFRHGLRMALGVGAAEVIAYVVAGQHSFWLPLTVVFVLRPDWSFTVTRGLNRVVGNLAAVTLLPALLLLLGPHAWGMAPALFVLTAITFRWFFGNYMVASFGLAGTVLLLDYTLNPQDTLFLVRIVATIVGSLIALLVILLIPEWTRSAAPHQVRELLDAVRQLRTSALEIVERPEDDADAVLEPDLAEARKKLTALQPTVTGVLLEPGSRGRPVPLAFLYMAASRQVAALMAICYPLMSAQEHGRRLSVEERQELVDRSGVTSTQAALSSAAHAYLDG